MQSYATEEMKRMGLSDVSPAHIVMKKKYFKIACNVYAMLSFVWNQGRGIKACACSLVFSDKENK